MRALIAVGCNAYRFMPPLSGAGGDASRVWARLTSPGTGQYDPTISKLLLSPTTQQLRHALEEASRIPTPLEVLTFFFAGHGGEKAGSYYFCLEDSEAERLSTTAYPLGSLLAVFSEMNPRQVNLILDACESAGGMYDFPAVLKKGALGATESMSISVFAACRSDEGAGETATGGFATTELLRYLDGERVVQTSRPYIDLVDVGRLVSNEIASTGADQTPVTWGINLHGESTFAANPNFIGTPGPTSGVPGVISVAVTGRVGEQFARELWDAHQQVGLEVLPHQLIPLLRGIAEELARERGATSTFFRGLSSSLRAAASDSADLLAQSHVIDCLLTVLLGREGEAGNSELQAELLHERCEIYETLAEHLDELLDERFGMVNHRHPLADLFFLPVRLTGILGWVSTHLIVSDILGLSSAAGDSVARNLMEKVVSTYDLSIRAMSDAQAPSIYLCAVACLRKGWTQLGEGMLAYLYLDLATNSCVTARLGLSPEQILRYLTERGRDPGRASPRLIANPSSVLSVTLLAGASLGLDAVWDEDMIIFDHKSCNYFVPRTYSAFGDVRIEEGTNFGFTIGHGVWTLADVRTFFDSVSPSVEKATADMTPIQKATAVIASSTLPDRLPLFLQLRDGSGVVYPSAPVDSVEPAPRKD